jgi:hypothetical protein
VAAHVAEAVPAATAPPLIARRAPGLASPLVPMLMATELSGGAPAPRAALLTAAAAPAPTAAAFVGFGERGAGLGARGSVVSSAREVASLDAFTAPQLALIPPPPPTPTPPRPHQPARSPPGFPRRTSTFGSAVKAAQLPR